MVAKVKHEKIKKISKKELLFSILSFKLHTVLQVLQETDQLIQKIYIKTVIGNALSEKIKYF